MLEVKLNRKRPDSYGGHRYAYHIGNAYLTFRQNDETGEIEDIHLQDERISYPFSLAVNTDNWLQLHRHGIPFSYPKSVDIQMVYSTKGSADECITQLNDLLNELNYLKELSDTIMSIFESSIHRDILEKYKKELMGYEY